MSSWRWSDGEEGEAALYNQEISWKGLERLWALPTPATKLLSRFVYVKASFCSVVLDFWVMRSIFLLDEDVWNQQIRLDGMIETTRILFHVVCPASSPVQACFLKKIE
jgi:hypothetical protein